MRRPTLIVGSAACALVLGTAPAAQAANPDIQRFEFSDAFTDPDFCGTGAAVEIAFHVKGVDFLDPKRDVDFMNISRGTQTFTYGDTTVVGHWANLYLFDGQELANGGFRFEDTFRGLPEQFRLQGGGRITLDAGTITFVTEFDAEGNVVDESVTWKGPHPQAASNFELFCEVIPEALGIEP